MLFRYTVDVGFTTQRPVRPDQHTHRLVLHAETDSDAHLFAAHWLGARPGCVMVTSTTIIEVEL